MEKGRGDVWSQQDLELVRELYGWVSTEELAEMLGRSHSAVVIKAHKLGVSARRKGEAPSEALGSFYTQRVWSNACELYGNAGQRKAYREGVRWAMSVLHVLLKEGHAEEAEAMSGELGRLVAVERTN